MMIGWEKMRECVYGEEERVLSRKGKSGKITINAQTKETNAYIMG